MKHKVDIVLRTHNNFALTDNCIRSLIANTTKNLYRLIIVDNGSDAPMRKYLNSLKKSIDNVVLILNSVNYGAVVASNQGMERFLKDNKAKYIMILDNDTEFLKGDCDWLERMLSYFDENTGAVGATSNKVSGYQSLRWAPFELECKFLISFAMIMSRDAILKTGKMDTLFNPGNFEDVDYTLRMREKGFDIKIAKDVFIHHHCHRTFEKITNLEKLIQTNTWKFMTKWGEKTLQNLGLRVV